MSLINESDVAAKAFLGAAYPLGGLCLIHPTQVKTAVAMGNSTYNKYVNLLVMEEYELLDHFKEKGIALEKVDVFDNLMESSQRDRNFLLELQSAFRTFIREQITILPEAKIVLIGNDEQGRKMGKKEFYLFQQVLRIQNRIISTAEEIPENETPMQKKFRLRREQVNLAKKKQQSKEGGDKITFQDIMSSICAELHYTVEEVSEMSVYALHDVFERMMERQKYHTDVDSIMAGANPKKVKPKNWTRKLKD